MHHPDAFERINGLDGATQKLFADYTKVEVLPSPVLLQKILLALELRWKIEEAV